jgi:hypothetical protein
MARKHKPPRPPASPPPALHDWRGFHAQRRSPQFGLLGCLAALAVVTTGVVAVVDRQVGSAFGEIWLFSLVALQLLVVAESRHWFRGAMRWLLPAATAFAVPLLLYWTLEVRTEAILLLGAIFLGMVLAPERWLDDLVAGPRG